MTLRPARDWVWTVCAQALGTPAHRDGTTLSPSPTNSRTKTIQAIIVAGTYSAGQRDARVTVHRRRPWAKLMTGGAIARKSSAPSPSPGRRRSGGRGHRRGLLGKRPLELAGVRGEKSLHLRRRPVRGAQRRQPLDEDVDRPSRRGVALTQAPGREHERLGACHQRSRS